MLLDPTLDIFLLFLCPKRIVGIVLMVVLKETLTVPFTWHSNVNSLQRNAARVYFRPL
jgi:hypothetical protein